jgi:hypothetical protein
MKKLTLLLLAILLLNGTGNAQTWRQRKQARADARIERKKTKKEMREERIRKREEGPPFHLSNTFAMYATPTDILSPYGALLPIGITYYFEKRFSVNADVAIPLFFNTLGILGENYRIKKTKSDIALHGDIKWYPKIKHTRRLFVGLEITFRQQHFAKASASLYYANWYSLLNLDAHKTTVGVGAFFGSEFRLKQRWLLEGKVGVGFRNVNMSHNFDPTGKYYKSGKFYNPNIPPKENEIGDNATTVYIPLALTFKYLLN